MLGKPHAGWCPVELNGEELGTASYLDWLPGIILDACIRYLEAVKNGYEGKVGFNIEFDAEGYYFGLVEVGDGIYTYDTCNHDTSDIRLLKNVAADYSDNALFVRDLALEVMSDIQAHFDDWMWWDALDEMDAKVRRKELLELFRRTEDLVYR